MASAFQKEILEKLYLSLLQIIEEKYGVNQSELLALNCPDLALSVYVKAIIDMLQYMKNSYRLDYEDAINELDRIAINYEAQLMRQKIRVVNKSNI